MSAVVLRSATERDAEAMATVWLASALRAYASIFPDDAPKPTHHALKETWRRDLGNGTALVAVDGEAIVGCVHAGVDGQLSRLYVHPDAWGGGIGARLHDAAVDVLRAGGHGMARLWVLEANPVRAMYERRSWIEDGRRRVVYPGIDDIGYVRSLRD